MGNNYIPLYVFLGIMIILGTLAFFLQPFSSLMIPDVTNSTISGTIFNYTAGAINGTTMDVPLLSDIPYLGTVFQNFHYNFFWFLPQEIKDYFITAITLLLYIPLWISIPLSLIAVTSLIYTIIKLFWGN